MNTKIFDIRNNTNWKSTLTEAAKMLAEGKIVAFPTETVYGLGANALNENAVQKIFEAKGRASDNPLIVHISSEEQLFPLVKEIPETAKLLMSHFWPGPLSMIFRKTDAVAGGITAGLSTVAVRIPQNEVARYLIQESGCPIAAPSANLSGAPSPTRAEHVIQDLDGKVDGIVLGDPCEVGLESTVIDLTVSPPAILRPGMITKEQIESVIGPVQFDAGSAEINSVPKSPGMKYVHYAPKASVVLFQGSLEEMVEGITKEVEIALQDQKWTGIIASDETITIYREKFPQPSVLIYSAGSRYQMKTIAHNLFYIFREMDQQKVDIIFSESFEESGIGLAVMNRMKKAAKKIQDKENPL